MTKNEHIQCVILAGGKGSRLDGKGKYQIKTKIGFLDHMLEQLSKHLYLIHI